MGVLLMTGCKHTSAHKAEKKAKESPAHHRGATTTGPDATPPQLSVKKLGGGGWGGWLEGLGGGRLEGRGGGGGGLEGVWGGGVRDGSNWGGGCPSLPPPLL